MEIEARAALSLPNQIYKIELKYDTFEKASFDSYLIAALIKNSQSEEQAMDYIDSITGNGSLNPHLKKEYRKLVKLSEEQIDGILKDSLFPITVVDRENRFKYYPTLDASVMRNRVYQGNLANYPSLSDLLMPNNKDAKFRDIDFIEESNSSESDMYNVILSDNEIKVGLNEKSYCPISKADFWSALNHEELKTTSPLMPSVRKTISDGNWSVLTNQIIDSWENNQLAYIDPEGNLAVLTNDFIKIVEVLDVFDLLFFKEARYQFCKANVSHVQDAIEYLMTSGNINSFKTKTLVRMLPLIKDTEAQTVLDYILSRKDSKELSEIGLSLIKNGLEKGWRTPTLNAIKRYTPSSECSLLYQINPHLEFTLNDLLNISDELLTKEDLSRKRDHLSTKNYMVQDIRKMIGEMAEVREKAKKLQKNSVVKEFNDFANKYIGHSKIQFDTLPMDKLEKEYKYVLSVYNGNYQKVKAALEKLND